MHVQTVDTRPLFRGGGGGGGGGGWPGKEANVQLYGGGLKPK